MFGGFQMLALVVAVAGPLQIFAVRVQLQANSSDAAVADVSLNSTATEEQMTGGACCCCYAPQNMFGGFKYTCPDKEWIRTKTCYPYVFPGVQPCRGTPIALAWPVLRKVQRVLFPNIPITHLASQAFTCLGTISKSGRVGIAYSFVLSLSAFVRRTTVVTGMNSAT